MLEKTFFGAPELLQKKLPSITPQQDAVKGHTKHLAISSVVL